MRIERTLWGPYVMVGETDAVVAIMQTDEGDEEFIFDTFHDWYQLDQELPKDYDEDELEDVDVVSLEAGYGYV